MKRNQFLVIFACCFVIFSCKKDKWNEPSAVNFIFDINKNPGLSDKLMFSDGYIVLENFSFEGDRIQGDDVYFSNSYSTGLNIEFNPGSSVSELNFDIPQGTFTKIMISFSTIGTVSGNHILINGTYSTGISNTYAVRFEYNSKETFSVMAMNSSGSNEIVLKKDESSTPKVVVDPIYWFQPVSLNLLNNAELVDINGVPTILINSNTNIEIYNIVLNRISDGVKITF